MTDTNVQFTSIDGRPAGAWRLPPGQALTLKSAQGGRVRVARGGLWATFDGPHAGPANDRGDHLLEAGELIALRPGERLVVESASRSASAYVEWEPGATTTGMAPGCVWSAAALRATCWAPRSQPPLGASSSRWRRWD